MPDIPDYYNWWSHEYATHQPFLETYVRSTTGDVIEFGIGYASTGFLRNILAGTGRKLISIEDCSEWLDTIKAAYPENSEHSYIYLTQKEDESHWKDFLKTYERAGVSVVFIDQSTYQSRAWTLQHFIDKVDYCVVHDADALCKPGLLGYRTDGLLRTDETRYKFNLENYKLYFPPAPWSESNHGPPTLVASGLNRPIIPYSDILFN